MAPSPLHCPACDHANPPASRFCNACGATLARPAAEGAAIAPGAPLDPAGRYEVERAIGRGGFGQAYLVYDRRLGRHCVAKQQLPDPAWGAQARALAAQNFQREAELLVSLNAPGHPNIPEIYEFLPEQGCLVMKYVEGRDLDQILTERGGLPAQEALAIARDVCSALAYMHGRQPDPVLHRDIKPSNILLDRAGRVWLIDFGLSRSLPAAVEPGAQGRSLVAGTLGFTPPEQWRGQAVPRSDIYALGVTLHTLVGGIRPQLSRADLPALLRGELPALPRPAQPIPAPLAALIAAATAHEPAARPDAAALLAALEELLAPAARAALQAPDGATIADEPALAAWAERRWELALGWLYGDLADQVGRLWARNRLAADIRAITERHAADRHAGLDALLALLDPGGFGAARPRLAAERATIDFGALEPDERREEALAIVNRGRRYLRASVEAPAWLRPSSLSLSLPPGAAARLRLRADMGRAPAGGALRGALLLRIPDGQSFRVGVLARAARWRSPWRRPAGLDWERRPARQLRSALAHRGGAWDVAFSPDGARIATVGWDGCLRLWRSADGELERQLTPGGNLLAVALSPDETLVAAAGDQGQIGIWEIAGGRLAHQIEPAGGYVERLLFSPDGQLLIAGVARGVGLWRAADAAPAGWLAGGPGLLALAAHPDGHSLAAAGAAGTISLWELGAAQPRHTLPGHPASVGSLAFSPDGDLLASGDADGLICLWEQPDGQLRARLRAHQGGLRGLAFHPDGHILASGGVDGTIRLWRADTGAPLAALSGHSSGVNRLCFSPDGEQLASVGGDGSLVIWAA